MIQRILFVLNRVDDQSGGTLSAAVNTANALVADDAVQVTFAVPVVAKTPTQTLNAMDPRIEVHKFAASRVAARFGASLRHFWWLAGHVRDYDCVHIHSAFYLGAAYTALICRISHVRYFVWSHGSLDHYDVHKHRRLKSVVGPLMIRPILSGSSGVLCTTARERSELQTYGSSARRCVVPLPVEGLDLNAEDGARWRATNNIDDATYLLLFLGRIAPKKGLLRLIDAMALLLDLEIVLAIAGAGDDPRDTELAHKRAAELGLSDRVRFLGWLSGKQRAGALAAADVFALPSDNENFAIAMVEALLAGVPVVASDQVYLGDELGPAGGLLVTRREPEAIAAAIRTLHTSSTLASEVASIGQAYARTHFAPATVAATLLAECDRSTA